MSDNSADILSTLNEMRDLLRLIAEPAIAQRDKKLREELRSIAGNLAGQKAKAIVLMDGSKTQSQIVAECGISKGNLSTLVKRLRSSNLIKSDFSLPELVISIPHNFFDSGESSND